MTAPSIAVSTIYFAVMQKSTGKFLPGVKTRGGYTHTEPQPFSLFPPRLHMHAGSARRAMTAYVKGRHMHKRYGESNFESFGPEYVDSIEVAKDSARDPNDFVVVTIHLTIGDPAKNLSDGRPNYLIGRFGDPDHLVMGYSVSPWGSDDKPEQDPPNT